MCRKIFDPKAIVLIPNGDETQARVVATTGPTDIMSTIHAVKKAGEDYGDSLTAFAVNKQTGDVKSKGITNLYETFPKDELMEDLY